MNNYLYIASRTKNGGIFTYALNKDNQYEKISFTAMDSPMYMITSEKKMYILLRSPFGNSESGLISYDISDDGTLNTPSDIISTKGEIACHLAKDGENIYCTNYSSGSVIKMPDTLVKHKSNLSIESHTHFASITPDGQYICVTDLGLDKIFIYDKNLRLINQIDMPKGHGVRHLAFSTDGQYVFSANELKSTISVLKYNNANMELIDTISCLPSEFNGISSAAAIRLHNEYIYVSNRGHNSISKISFNGKSLHFVDFFECQGETPRDFIFDENRIICANQDSNSVTVFKENEGYEFIQKINIDEPICVTLYNFKKED